MVGGGDDDVVWLLLESCWLAGSGRVGGFGDALGSTTCIGFFDEGVMFGSDDCG
jgi:hypothetical protein